MSFRTVISNIFEEHDLEPEFYNPWYNLLGRIGSVELVTFVDILRDSSKDELVTLTQDLHEKIEVLEAEDGRRWSEIIDREKQEIVI